MKTAAVAELKASLSRFLASVKSGQEVVVTERGRPIAKIVPLPAAGQNEERRLRDMEVKGLVRQGTGKLPSGFWTGRRPPDPDAKVRRALTEEREEGR